MPLDHPVLIGTLVSLEPLSLEHAPGLWAVAQTIAEAASITLIPRSLVETERYVRDALDGQAREAILPYVVIAQSSQSIIGTTRFANIERWKLPTRPDGIDVVEIGWTFYAAHAQRSGVNTEVKLLMLTHAFDVLDVHRVTIKTDALNTRSRAAIERIGASFEGILRNHLPSATGGVRDTAMYSITRQDWPHVREHLHSLTRRLAPH